MKFNNTESGLRPKIIQILIGPNDACWQNILLGLGNDGVVYHYSKGFWEVYAQALGSEEEINLKERKNV